jgi:hypothetical protein
MLTRCFFTPSGKGLGPGFLRRNRIRLPLSVVIIVIYFSSSIKLKRHFFLPASVTCLVAGSAFIYALSIMRVILGLASQNSGT